MHHTAFALCWTEENSHKQNCAVAMYFATHQINTASENELYYRDVKAESGKSDQKHWLLKFFNPREYESGVLCSSQGIVLKSPTETFTIQDRSKC